MKTEEYHYVEITWIKRTKQMTELKKFLNILIIQTNFKFKMMQITFLRKDRWMNDISPEDRGTTINRLSKITRS